jgi:hypothetical protein
MTGHEPKKDGSIVFGAMRVQPETRDVTSESEALPDDANSC